jgi:O-succinylbenzoate synthase
MRIDAINLYLVSLPLRRPLPGPASRHATLETVVVELRGGGISGWGEACPGNAPVRYGEWSVGVFRCLRDWLAPAVLGHTIYSGEELQELLAPFHGNRFAKAALDTAWWDLKARHEGAPLHQAIGGRHNALEVGLTFDQMESPEEFLAEVQAAFGAGFGRVKLKMRPGWDINMVEAVRRELPLETLHVDLEGTLTLAHSEILYRLDDFQLAMVEQPLGPDDLVAHAMLQESLRTPVCLDESIASHVHAEMALDLKSCRYINLKSGRTGGITEALMIADMAAAQSVSCFGAATPQSALGCRIDLALAARCDGSYPADYFPAERFLAADLAEPLLPARDPTDGKQRIVLWSSVGLGVEPDRQCLERLSLEQAAL